MIEPVSFIAGCITTLAVCVMLYLAGVRYNNANSLSQSSTINAMVEDSPTLVDTTETTNERTAMYTDASGSRPIYLGSSERIGLPTKYQMMKFIDCPTPSRSEFTGNPVVYSVCKRIAVEENMVSILPNGGMKWHAKQYASRLQWANSLYPKD